MLQVARSYVISLSFSPSSSYKYALKLLFKFKKKNNFLDHTYLSKYYPISYSLQSKTFQRDIYILPTSLPSLTLFSLIHSSAHSRMTSVTFVLMKLFLLRPMAMTVLPIQWSYLYSYHHPFNFSVSFLRTFLSE